MHFRSIVVLLALWVGSPSLAQTPSPDNPPETPLNIPAAIYTDPVEDPAHPARSRVLHISSNGVDINGLAYVASGEGLHPTFVLLHGIPGAEKNLDLAQAIRRAGWNVVTMNYRGSWGSPGDYACAHTLEDADALLTYLREPGIVKSLQIDTTRIVLGGHSVGGWVVAMTAAKDKELFGAVLISAADIGAWGHRLTKASLIHFFDTNRDSLTGLTAEGFADEVIGHADDWSFAAIAPGLTDTPLLILSAADDNAADSDALFAAIQSQGGTHATIAHEATDKAWSTKRIALEAHVINWLDDLLKAPESP